MVLEKLEPQNVWYIFENIIAGTPRPSKSEDKIRKEIKTFLLNLGKESNVEYIIQEDSVGNLFIKKPVVEGREGAPSILFQAHLDMVCETDRELGFNFKENKIPIRIQENGEWVDADGTTLGADNGIGLALILALLTDKTLQHFPIEALFTVNEEDGFTGATNFKSENFDINSKYMINLDSGPIGEVIIGSVCGRRVYLRKRLDYIQTRREDLIFYNINIEGLQGGHSGGDIHLPRGNANKLMARILSYINEETELFLYDWNGGNKANVIDRKSNSIVAIRSKDQEKFEQLFHSEKETLYDYYKNKNPVLEPDLNINLHLIEPKNKYISSRDTKAIITTAKIIRHGVIKYSPFFDEFVETSNNFGTVKTENDIIEFCYYPRSIYRSELNNFVRKLILISEFANWTKKLRPILPEWKPEPDTPFLNYIKSLYEKILKEPIKINVVHGGLETGMFNNKMPDMNIISLGPTIIGEHSPNEKVKINDIKILYRLLIKIVKNISQLNQM